ncbi:MAG: hypothetical protein ACYC5Y_09355 [Symbiobacteriia bacterium]
MLPFNTWSDLRWWGAALTGGIYILLFFFALSLVRRQLVLTRLGGKPLQEWRPTQVDWLGYQKRWSSALLTQLITWVVFYALLLAVLDRSGGFWPALLRYAVFSVLVLGPFAIANFLLTRWNPTRYVVTERGIGSINWAPFGVQGTAGLTDASFRPWSNVLGYYWAEGDLVLVVRRSFLSPQRFNVIMPPGGRRTLEDLLHSRGLTKVTKEAAPAKGKAALGQGKRPTDKGKSPTDKGKSLTDKGKEGRGGRGRGNKG